MRGFWFGALCTVMAGLMAAFGVMGLGLVPVSADAKPGAIEKWLADFAREAALERAAPDTPNPVPVTPDALLAGAKLYRDNCSGCHGAPDTTDNVFASALYPPAPQFLGARGPKHLHDAEGEIFVVIRDGIRLTGMPTFTHMLKETEIWQLVTFLKHLDQLPPDVLGALSAPASGG